MTRLYLAGIACMLALLVVVLIVEGLAFLPVLLEGHP